MGLETTKWDPLDSLTSPEAELAYLKAAFDDGDPTLIAAVMGDVVRVAKRSVIDTGSPKRKVPGIATFRSDQ